MRRHFVNTLYLYSSFMRRYFTDTLVYIQQLNEYKFCGHPVYKHQLNACISDGQSVISSPVLQLC